MRAFFSKMASSETVAGYIFLLPNFLGFLIFTSLPVLASLGLSFTQWDILTPPKFVGLANFAKLLGFHSEAGRFLPNDPQFWQYAYNTLFLMLAIPINMIGALVVALAMHQKLRGITFFRTIYFLPTVCAGVAICMLWRWIYNPDFGMLNAFLIKIFHIMHLPIQPPNWLSSTLWAKPALMLMGFWGSIGGVNMLLYLAALHNVPRELYEAAEIDGAGNWQRFRAVTLPFLSPTTFFIFIMGIIGGFQGGFMQANIMTNGGPAGATTTIDYYIYNTAYRDFNMGYAASVAWILFIVVLAVTLVNWRYGGKLVHF